MSTPLILGAVGEIIAERTGMMVTAVEGIFLAGAFGGFIGVYSTGNYLVGFLFAMICGLLVAMLYGLTTVYMNQHQIVMGTAIAILIAGFCKFFFPRNLWYSAHSTENRASASFEDTHSF